ncbi:MAG: hypothetical protein R6X02_10880, partial [Enhygromyxa sp.]
NTPLAMLFSSRLLGRICGLYSLSRGERKQLLLLTGPTYKKSRQHSQLPTVGCVIPQIGFGQKFC